MIIKIVNTQKIQTIASLNYMKNTKIPELFSFLFQMKVLTPSKTSLTVNNPVLELHCNIQHLLNPKKKKKIANTTTEWHLQHIVGTDPSSAKDPEGVKMRYHKPLDLQWIPFGAIYSRKGNLL